MRLQIIKTFIIFSLFLVPTSSFALSDQIYKELENFTRLIELLDKQYVDEVDEEKLIKGAIDGMLSTLDPHTLYLPEKLYQEFKQDTTGKYGGVGLEVTIQDGILTVVSPIEGGPASKAGIKSGDRILKIDDESTKAMTLWDAVSKMRGKRGRKVLVTVFREGVKEAIEYNLVREIIKTHSVKQELLENSIAYLRISSFQENTAEDVKNSLKKLEKKSGEKLKGIIIDLTDNPGGLLKESVDIADLFIKKGVIVSTRDRNEHLEILRANNQSEYENIPIVLIVNQGSASASEILAGALKDHNRAKIIGSTTFGKGSVQTIVELDKKSAVKLTIARYYTPKGKSIDGQGIKPDIVIEDLPSKLKNDPENKLDLKAYQIQQSLKYLK
jgi:carboxyl-terminal processing protease